MVAIRDCGIRFQSTEEGFGEMVDFATAFGDAKDEIPQQGDSLLRGDRIIGCRIDERVQCVKASYRHEIADVVLRAEPLG